MKNLLFITWDGPQTSYMEGLFMPIFNEIAKTTDIEFHVLQFTWGDRHRIEMTQKAAKNLGIHYTSVAICRKPIVFLGSLFTLFSSVSIIKKYLITHNIDWVMPRSTFPAFMINRIRRKNFKVIFDADGLPIEERVDFAGLKKGSVHYKWLKSIEVKMLKKADYVITRSQKSIDFHLQNIGYKFRDKFSVVFNGRDSKQFCFNPEERLVIREELELRPEELLFVYAGSMGPQYCMNEMLEIVKIVSKEMKVKFLILTADVTFAQKNVPVNLVKKVIIKKVAVEQVASYLNAADLAFALRKSTLSMQGVAPIKLGEYLLCGLPVIASKGIGDSEEILENFVQCYLYHHDSIIAQQQDDLMAFIRESIITNRLLIQDEARECFSLQAAANSYIKAFDRLQSIRE